MKNCLKLVSAMFALRLVLVAASAGETNVPVSRSEITQQAIARSWLATNTVAAGRTRGDAAPPVRRALLVGINTYEPTAEERQKQAAAAKPVKSKKPGRGNFQDLDGCVNDVEEMRALLIARFGFKPGEILMLTNRQATREAIFDGIDRHLIQASRSNDVAFFFYAGHGSQVVNSKSDEPDKRDETIVPADSWAGVPDIRDKELRRVFNAVLDKGALLTAIFDSCHSGSTARGNAVERRVRRADTILTDIADATNYGPSPEERGALILSAAQDDQLAEEQGAGSVPHGAFTAALLRMLRVSPIGRTAADIFLSVSTALQAAGHMQVPVLSGTETRRRMGLFGGDEELSGGVAVAVLAVGADGEINLQGGRGAGLNAGCQLRQTVADTNAPAVGLQVTRVDGLMAAQAKVIEGDAKNVHAGDVFIVSRWVIAPEAMLRVWLPLGSLTPDQVQPALKLAAALRTSNAIEWIDDPTQISPTHFLGWDGNRWLLSAGNQQLARFDEKPDVAQILKAIPVSGARPKLFMSLPPTAELKAALTLGRSAANDAIEVVQQPADANYVLVGTVRGGALRYAWVLPNAQANANDPLPLPVRTYWFPTNNEPAVSWTVVAHQLEDSALRVGRVKAWLTLESPADDGRFPYRLALKRTATGNLIKGDELKLETSGETGRKQMRRILPVLKGDEFFSVVIQAEAETLNRGVEPRYVYVFTLDSDGVSQLIWPSRGQGNSQRLPAPADNNGYPKTISLAEGISSGEPYGVDTYVMLTSLTAIPDATVLEFRGVRSRSRGGMDFNPLQNLLESVGNPKRAPKMEAPADWSIQRITVLSVAPAPLKP